MIIGSKKDKLEDIVRDMKKHTSLELKEAIKSNAHESRKEWIIWIARPDASGMEMADKKNGITKIGIPTVGGTGNSIINLLKLQDSKCLMKSCFIYIKTFCRQALLQEKKIGSIVVQEISAG